MFHRHTKAGTICRPVSGGMIPAVLLFHYFSCDCPLCTPMASTGLFVFPNIFHFFASVWVSGFHMSLILLHNVISIMLFIECQLNLFKRKIILFSLIFHCGISLIAVPVNILPDSFIVDMLTVFRIKSPIIMKRIVNSIFPRSGLPSKG